jgi:hypothetical protein
VREAALWACAGVESDEIKTTGAAQKSAGLQARFMVM